MIVKDNKIIAEAYHEKYGQAHAEINALAIAGVHAKGSDLFVSMEPCAHFGKTGPCCDAVIAAGVSRVIFGMLDPNPLVAGKGIEKIAAAGISIEGPLLEDEAQLINQGFIKRMKTGLPFIRCKLAMSLDGRTAMASGESNWISGEEARADAQLLRARSDAILTGIGTVLADDPSLNVRFEEMPELQELHESIAQPLRVIVDSNLSTPAHAKILSLPGEVLIATARTDEKFADNRAEKLFSAQKAQIQILNFPSNNHQVDLLNVLKYLATERQSNEVLLECGARLAGSMIKLGLVDELITYIAPKLLGSDARPLFELPGLEDLAQHINLEIIDVEKIGKDCKIRSRPVKSTI